MPRKKASRMGAWLLQWWEETSESRFVAVRSEQPRRAKAREAMARAGEGVERMEGAEGWGFELVMLHGLGVGIGGMGAL